MTTRAETRRLLRSDAEWDRMLRSAGLVPARSAGRMEPRPCRRHSFTSKINGRPVCSWCGRLGAV